jgi:hypothetical protein
MRQRYSQVLPLAAADAATFRALIIPGCGLVGAAWAAVPRPHLDRARAGNVGGNWDGACGGMGWNHISRGPRPTSRPHTLVHPASAGS